MTYREIYKDLHLDIWCKDSQRWYNALYRRKEFLNSVFELSSENITKLQLLNDRFIELIEDVYEEGDRQAKLLYMRNNDEELFLDNWTIIYTIEITSSYYYDIYDRLKDSPYKKAIYLGGIVVLGGNAEWDNNIDFNQSYEGDEYPIGNLIKNLCSPMKYFTGEHSPYSLRDLVRMDKVCATLSVKLRNVKCF